MTEVFLNIVRTYVIISIKDIVKQSENRPQRHMIQNLCNKIYKFYLIIMFMYMTTGRYKCVYVYDYRALQMIIMFMYMTARRYT